MLHTRQSRPDFGLGFQAEVFEGVPVPLGRRSAKALPVFRLRAEATHACLGVGSVELRPFEVE